MTVKEKHMDMGVKIIQKQFITTVQSVSWDLKE